jgi:hypothetical protein
MEITKKILGLLLGFLLNCSDIYAKPTPATQSFDVDDLGDLNSSIDELERQTSYTWKAMVRVVRTFLKPSGSLANDMNVWRW